MPHVHLHAAQPAGEIAEASTASPEVIRLEQDILAKNNQLAAQNREWFQRQHILALNVLGSPGAGKTSLLVRTITDLGATLPCFVVEGDQATRHDADRITGAGGAAVQINTGPGCHLEADMLAGGLEKLQPEPASLLFIENVGNLVCPALFDLGETLRVVLLSVTEGEDKPLKYPHMFRSADLVLLHKSDLLPHLDYDVKRCIAYAREVKPGVEVLPVSSKTGQGMQAWYDWLRLKRAGLFVGKDLSRGRVAGESKA